MTKFTACLLSLSLLHASQASADEKLGDLLVSHDKAVRQACLALHKKLESELEKVRAQRAQSNDPTALKKVDNELRVIRQDIRDLTVERSASGTGVNLNDLDLWHVGGRSIWGDWRNFTVETAANGTHKLTNTSTLATLIFHKDKFASDFEVEIKYIGQVDSAGLVTTNPMGKESITVSGSTMNASDGKTHTLTVKRKDQKISFEVDRKELTTVAMNANEPLFECYVMMNMPPTSSIELVSWEAGAHQ